MLTTKATIAASRITGSANMKTGIVPEVRVTTPEFQKVCKSVVYVWLGRITVEVFG